MKRKKITLVPYLFLVMSIFFIHAGYASNPATFIDATFIKAGIIAKEKKARGENPYEAYADATATIATKAASLAKEQRNQMLTLLCASLKKIFQIPATTQPTTAKNDGADREVGKPFAEYMPDYATAVTTIITSTLFKFRSNKLLQGSIIDALCHYLKELFDLQESVTALFTAAPSLPAGYAQVAYTIITTKLQAEPPLRRGLIINALCNELLQKVHASSSATADTDEDTVNEQINALFKDAKTSEDYASVTKTIVSNLDKSTPYERFLMINRLRTILLWYITPPEAKVGQWQPGETAQKKAICEWYEVDCWVGELHDITTQAVWKPFGELVEKGARKVGKTITDAGSWISDRFKDTQVTRAIDYGIRKGALESALALATGVLKTAQETAKGTLLASKAVAEKAMSASQELLDGVNSASKIVLQGSADIASGALEGVKQGSLAVLEGGSIVTKGILELFDIEEIKYKGTLAALKSGSLGNVSIQAAVFKKKFDLKVTLDIKKGYNAVTDALNKAVQPVIDRLSDELLLPYERKIKKLQLETKKIEKSLQATANVEAQVQAAEDSALQAEQRVTQLETQEDKAQKDIQATIKQANEKAINALEEEEKKHP